MFFQENAHRQRVEIDAYMHILLAVQTGTPCFYISLFVFERELGKRISILYIYVFNYVENVQSVTILTTIEKRTPTDLTQGADCSLD